MLNADSELATSRRSWLLTVLAVGAAFLAYSFWCAPIPGTNEPHYLCKAKHYWDSDWCRRDMFLTSSNPHLVFYVTLGWLTRFLSLETVAVIGRLTGYLALAVGWTQFSQALGLTRRGTVAAAVLVLFWASWLSLSGEWLVGGIESKTYAFAAVFAGIATAMQQRWRMTGLLLGVAVAFHPLVGLWSVIAAVMAVAAARMTRVIKVGETLRQARFWSGSLLFVIVAAAGIVPALAVVGSDNSAAAKQQAFAANYIQVFYRLSHHLDPMQFPTANYVLYLGLLALACGLSRRLVPSRSLSWFRWFVLSAAFIALCGWVAGYGPRPRAADMPLFELRMLILKFYPFRLVDAFVPIFLSVVVVRWLSDQARFMPRARWVRWSPSLLAGLFCVALVLGRGNGSARYLPDDREQEWLAVCEWVEAQTPQDSLFVTPNESWGFKWFAQRAEYVAFKDCPQDAANLVEWNSRLRWLGNWAAAGFEDQVYSPEDIARLVQKTGATHFIARKPSRLEAPLVFENRAYAIYRLD